MDDVENDFDVDVAEVKDETVKFDDIVANTNSAGAWQSHENIAKTASLKDSLNMDHNPLLCVVSEPVVL